MELNLGSPGGWQDPGHFHQHHINKRQDWIQRSQDSEGFLMPGSWSKLTPMCQIFTPRIQYFKTGNTPKEKENIKSKIKTMKSVFEGQ